MSDFGYEFEVERFLRSISDDQTFSAKWSYVCGTCYVSDCLYVRMSTVVACIDRYARDMSESSEKVL